MVNYYRQNGAGKTSLLESMLQLIKYKGLMTYDNKELKKIKHAAQHMYLVYQNPELQFITNSVYDEVHIHYNHLDSENAKQETMQLLSYFIWIRFKTNILLKYQLDKNDV